MLERCISIIISEHVRSQIFLFNITCDAITSSCQQGPHTNTVQSSISSLISYSGRYTQWHLGGCPSITFYRQRTCYIGLSIHEFSLTPTDQALFRDGYRCVVTGKYDMSSVLVIKELREKLNADRSLKTDGTQCAHIFAESTNQDIDLGSSKVRPCLSAWFLMIIFCIERDYAATMWAVMVRFGYTQLPDDLNGSNVHRLENVMTVVPGFHLAFDWLKVWLVATVRLT